MRWHGLKTEVTSCVFEYSRSDLMGILNYFKDAVIGYFDMGVLNVQKLTSWVLWIFMKWTYGYFEYLWGDVIGILNNEVTLWKYSEADVMGILKFIFIFKITRLLWIFKIPMTSLQEYSKYQCHYEYSKYPCHIKKYTSFEYSKYPWRQLLNIPMTSLSEYSKYQWRHFVNIQNASFEYSKAVAMVTLKIHEVM